MSGLRGCRSRELRGGVLLTGCDCIRKNGLQDDCRRSQCHGSPGCLVQPSPTCPPGILALKRIRNAPIPRRPPRVDPFEVECKNPEAEQPNSYAGSNVCPKCGRELGPCDTECPHCSSGKVEKITSLRAINHCSCGAQIKPGETICKECAQKGKKTGHTESSPKKGESCSHQKDHSGGAHHSNKHNDQHHTRAADPTNKQDPGVLVCFPLTMGEKEINQYVNNHKK